MLAQDVVLHTLRVIRQTCREEPIGINAVYPYLNYLFHSS